MHPSYNFGAFGDKYQLETLRSKGRGHSDTLRRRHTDRWFSVVRHFVYKLFVLVLRQLYQ